MLITRRSQIKREHAEQLALKLRLEAGLAADVRGVLRGLNADFADGYARGRRFPDVNQARPLLTALLAAHYQLVGKTFKDNLRSSVATPKGWVTLLEVKATPAQVDRAVNTRLVANVQTRARRQAGYILSTFAERLRNAVKRVVVAAAAEGVSLTDAAVAARASADVAAVIPAEAATVAVTETQHAAELTKFIEARALTEANVVDAEKLWKATLDERTRIAHIFADGQQVPLDDPFIVGAEELLHPGDESLGASLWNVINCRCNTLYIDNT